MEWGTFTPAHILTLIAAAAILVGLYFVLKNRPRKVQTAVLFCLSCSGIAAIIFNLVRWDSPLEYLPLHLCSINALILPVAVLTRSKVWCNLLLVWCLGALAALILNYEMTETVIFGEAFNFYYFPHIFEFGIPLLLFKLGHVKKDVKCIGSTLLITMLIYTLVHLCNLSINHYCAAIGSDIRVNYMFSINPTNPLVALFHNLVPFPYWYMYMVLPIVAGYLLIIYTPELMANRKLITLRKQKTA